MHMEEKEKRCHQYIVYIMYTYNSQKACLIESYQLCQEGSKRRDGAHLLSIQMENHTPPPTNPNHQSMKKMGSNNFGIYQFVFLPFLL